MKNNIPPNGHSHIDNKLANALRFREGQLRDALKQIQTLSLGIQSISTLAAMYKERLHALTTHNDILCTNEDATEAMNKASKLLNAGHMEPVNEILRLRAELEKANALTGSQANMMEQLEKEVRDLTTRLTATEGTLQNTQYALKEVQDLYNQTKKEGL